MRPPSVDALARSLVDDGLPHPLLVDVARAAIAAGDPDVGPRPRPSGRQRALLRPVVNATGVLLHTNLGRAPLGGTGSRPATPTSSSTSTPAQRGSRHDHAAALLARACGAEAALVVNNGAAAVLLVAGRAGRGRERGREPGRAGGDRRRVPRPRGDGQQSGARLVEVGHHQPHPPRRLRGALDRRAADVALRAEGAPVELPDRRASPRRRRWPSCSRRSAPPVVVDIGSGLLDAACPWLPDGPPAWLAGEPAVRQTLARAPRLVTFSGDKLLGGPQAGVIAGRPTSSAACAAPPAGPRPAARRARARRPAGGRPRLPPAATATPSRSGAWPPSRSRALRARAEAPRRRRGGRHCSRCRARGTLPGVDDPVGRRRRRRRPPRRAAGRTSRRSSPGSQDGRTISTCARSTPPTTPSLAQALRRPVARPAASCTSSPPPATSTTGSRPSSWPSPAPTPTAWPRRSAGA